MKTMIAAAAFALSLAGAASAAATGALEDKKKDAQAHA